MELELLPESSKFVWLYSKVELIRLYKAYILKKIGLQSTHNNGEGVGCLQGLGEMSLPSQKVTERPDSQLETLKGI